MQLGFEGFQSKDICHHIVQSAHTEISDQLRRIAENSPIYATPEFSEIVTETFSSNILGQLHRANAFTREGLDLGLPAVEDFIELASLFADTPSAFLKYWVADLSSQIYGSPSPKKQDWGLVEGIDSSTIYKVYAGGVLNYIGFAYSAFRAVCNVWCYLRVVSPAWMDVLSENQVKNLSFFDFSEKLFESLNAQHQQLESQPEVDYPDLAYFDDPEELELDEEESVKKFTAAETALVFTALFKSAGINNCDLSAKARLICAITGGNYDNIYKRLLRPFEGTDKTVFKRQNNILPYLKDLNDESIVLNIKHQ